jgi:hypothetical protein
MLDRMNTDDNPTAPGAERRPVPFYGSYASFVRVMKALKEAGIPKRVTPRSLIPLVGREEGPRISTHFSSMGWTDTNDKPTDELGRLVAAFGEKSWKSVLTEATQKFYSFVPQPWGDLTSSDLHEAFLSYTGREAKVITAAETFFLALALECGLELSERLYIRAARAHSEMVKRAKLSVQEVGDTVAISASAKLSAAPPAPSTMRTETPTVSLSISADIEQINLIMKLSKLLGAPDLTDEERKAIAKTISVLGRTNAA